MSTSVPLTDIKIGERARKDMGDIKALAESIQEHGLLHPVVILKDRTLVAGGRRLAAAGLLGWEEVPVTVVDVTDLLSAERDENVIRKDLTPTEAVALGKLIEAAHVEETKDKRQIQQKMAGKISRAKQLGDNEKVNELRAQMPEPSGQARDVAAAAVGMSSGSYQRARQVVEAAETEPETYGDLPEVMDSTNVAEAHREMERRKKGETARSAVHYKAQYPKPNREMERGLTTLEGLVSGFALVELEQLDRTQTQEWAKRLKAAALFLGKLSRNVGRMHV